MKHILSVFILLLACVSFIEAKVTVPGSLTHENSLEKGASIEGSIPIQNTGDEVATVKITLSDYLYNAEGETFFPEEGKTARSNATWVEFGQAELSIAPHTTYHMPYKVKVPKNKDLEGTYWSIFLIEPITGNGSAAEKKQSLGVQTIIRYGVQVITHIKNTGSYDLKIIDKSLVQKEKQKLLSVSVLNSGSLLQNPVFFVELISKEGKPAGKFSANKQRLLPSCSATYQVDLSGLSSGEYTALVFLDHGEGAFFGAKYEIKLD